MIVKIEDMFFIIYNVYFLNIQIWQNVRQVKLKDVWSNCTEYSVTGSTGPINLYSFHPYL